MKKTYMEPIVDLLQLENEDVLTTSVAGVGYDPFGDDIFI